QPIAAAEVGERLAALAAGTPQGRAQDLAGPREEALDAMVKTYAKSIGHRGWVPSVSIPTKQMKGMRAGLALPGADAALGRQSVPSATFFAFRSCSSPKRRLSSGSHDRRH